MPLKSIVSLLLMALVCIMPHSFAQHDTHGSPEPSPRAASDIIKILLDKAGAVTPQAEDSVAIRWPGTVLNAFSLAIATRDMSDAFGPGKSSHVSARCVYIGVPSGIDREEECFVAVSDKVTREILRFAFVYSAKADEVRDVSMM